MQVLGTRTTPLLRRWNASRPLGVRAMSGIRAMPPPFRKLMAANRGEIALRIMRATTELDMVSVGVYSYEDRYLPHRYKADQSFMLDRSKGPVSQYLDIDRIIAIARANSVDAIHPGYGFLSENADFAEACAQSGITFVGPTPGNLRDFADKTTARALAIRSGVPVVPGSDGPIATLGAARAFAEEAGYPVIIKAAMGGGGRGMRVVRGPGELEEAFGRATSEAAAAFGDGTVFLERYVQNPRHIEVQVLGDSEGNVVHLFERDCSVQRRHQKVVEIAPAKDLDPAVRERLLGDAVRLAREAGYRNAGTVEFLVDESGEHFFIEVNPRVQVEHTVTEEATGLDIVQSQMRIAGGETLRDLGLSQDTITTNGYAIQCRITTENPLRGFQPDSGTLEVYRNAAGNGIRLDGIGFTGAIITPHYDSLLVKVTGRARTFDATAAKLRRALREFRIRGVSTNIPFLVNVLSHPDFLTGSVHTGFIDDHPELLQITRDGQNRAQRLLAYLGDRAVNGRDPALGASGPPPAAIEPVAPERTRRVRAEDGLKGVLDREGPEGFARAVRRHEGLLLTDTTWRDAHQSLLATRMRTRDMAAVAPATADILSNCYSLENWGGATFDVAMRFLHECPWDRLGQLRELVPNVPFQMLLRGANAVGYTSYPDNAVHQFARLSVQHGMDVFRVFDSLNYIENMKLGIDAVGSAGGVIEAAVCYSGDITDENKGKYTLEYYLNFVRELERLGIHVLAIKDMAGLLKPNAAAKLVGAIRSEFPDLPIHVHTHDTAGTGATSMLAAAEAGADAVDVALDAMSGMTSQPAMGAVVAALRGTPLDTGIDLERIAPLNDYWEECRGLYAPFESGQKSGSADVYLHEMPGGQLTNLMFQSHQLGLSGRWPAIKRAYAAANRILGDIIKVTPSSKVVGDLAQFMVQNELSEQEVMERAEELSFPQSVIEFLQGYLGIPYGGFPEPFRSRVLKGKLLPNGRETFAGRPGAEMEPIDFEAVRRELEEKHGEKMRDVEVISSVMYPKVFDDYKQFSKRYGNVSILPTGAFVEPLKVGEEVSMELEHGKTLFVRLKQIGPPRTNGTREVVFEINGEARSLSIRDEAQGATAVTRERADASNLGHVAAPMPGAVVDVRVKPGQEVQRGDAVAVLSAMKMETVVTAPRSGVIKRLAVSEGDHMDAGDLIVDMGGEAAE